MPDVPYLAHLGESARGRVTPDLVQQVRAAIDRDGTWTDTYDWRISTETTRAVRVVELRGHRWFEVVVSCDREMQCHSSTLERALECMFVFERLLMDLFWTEGWASWAERQRRDPAPGSTTP